MRQLAANRSMLGARLTRALGLPLGEALIMLIVASAAIRLAPFRSIAGLLKRKTASDTAVQAADAGRLRAALDAWGRRLPWRTMCFEKGLAAHWMLLRRGRSSTLFYGVGLGEDKLRAHVWVRSGQTDVVGCEEAGEFAVLVCFPSADSVSVG